jgi:hypothetical protein
LKYLQSGGFQEQPLMRLTLGLALLLLAGFWVTNLGLYFSHMSLDPASVVDYYRGNEAEFRPARSAVGMLEVTHMHLPMFALVFLLLTHLMIFAPLRSQVKVVFIAAAFGSALLSEAAGWMTRFWHPGFASLKVAMFVLMQATLGWLILALARVLSSSEAARRHKRAERHRDHSRPQRAADGPERDLGDGHQA